MPSQSSKAVRTCAHCGAPFSPRYAPQRFCLLACWFAFQRSEPIGQRLARRTDRTGSCWLWTGATYSNGYGHLGATDSSGQMRDYLAHRVAWEAADGKPIPAIPADLKVLHTCDNTRCVRNDEQGTYEVNGKLLPRWGHLALGTGLDNSADSLAKGRANTGDRNGMRRYPERHARKLTPDHIEQARALYASGIHVAEIARRLNVNWTTADRAVKSQPCRTERNEHTEAHGAAIPRQKRTG
jgi:hypothetical protein